MIKEFITGKKYRYTGKERLDGWNDVGEMDFVLDGKPRIAIKADGCHANFIGTDSENRPSPWYWGDGFENWVEVTESIIAEESSY